MLGTSLVPVRVELRSVPAGRGTTIQEQVERSLLDATGQHIAWPDLCRAASGATPVIFLDGLDELLQAGTEDQGDYLQRVQEFQEREAEAGRPVCVVVTARTSVADRFRYPDKTIVARLEPFDTERISRWLASWNSANAGRQELSHSLIAPYGALASQPLLLLMLAMHMTGEPASADMREPRTNAQLYEELFTSFVFREMRRRSPGLNDAAVREAAEGELDCLGVLALGMFNRRHESAAEPDLDADLTAFLRARTGAHPARPECSAQDLANRFFFIYEAQATHLDGRASRTYEFLHATFGEFLIARLAVRLSSRIATATATAGDGPGPESALSVLRSLLSFSALCSRAPVVEFCAGLYELLPEATREDSRRLLGDLFSDAMWLEPFASLLDYRPVAVPWAARTAAYSANLLLLLVLAARGDVDAASLLGADDTAEKWRRYALLWESQLAPEEWRSLWATLRVVGEPGEPAPDTQSLPVQKMIHVRREDAAPVPLRNMLPDLADQAKAGSEVPEPAESVLLGVPVPANSALGEVLREAAFRSDDSWVKDVMSVIGPMWGRPGDTVTRRTEDAGARRPELRLHAELLSGRVANGSSAHSREGYLSALRKEVDTGGSRGNSSDWVMLNLLYKQLTVDARWMDPEDVRKILLVGFEARLTDDRFYQVNYEDPVRVLAHRSDTPQEVIKDLLYPFWFDDLDSQDTEFDSMLHSLQTELGFPVSTLRPPEES